MSTCNAVVGFGMILNDHKDPKIDYRDQIETKIREQKLTEYLAVYTAGDFSGNDASYTNILLIKDSIIKTSGSNIVEYSYATKISKFGQWIETLKIFCEKNDIPFDLNDIKFYLFGNYS